MTEPRDLETGAEAPELSGASSEGLATRFVTPAPAASSTTATATTTVAPPVAPPEEGLDADGTAAHDLEPFDSGHDEWFDVPEQPAAEVERRSRVLLRAGLAASTAGLCLLLFLVYVNSFSTLQQHRQQHILLNDYTATNRASILTRTSLADGQPAGVLSIPALHLNQVVVQGTSATDLLKGPGLMPGTAKPGSLGNAVIAGHRTIAGSPFAHLNLLRRGDRIIVVTPAGRYRYSVLAVGTTRPGQRDPISPNRHPRLTLVTSNPSGSGRLYVVAALRTTPNRLPIPRHPPTPAEKGLSGDSAAVGPSILWGLLLAAAFAVTFYAYWRFRGRHWSVYLLSTPVLLAIAFVWYGNLIRLLPGTM